MPVLQTLSDVQVTVAPLTAPVRSTRPSGAVRLAPLAAFQKPWATTPAFSPVPIAVPRPTKSMAIAEGMGNAVSTRAAAATARRGISKKIDRAAIIPSRPAHVPLLIIRVNSAAWWHPAPRCERRANAGLAWLC